MSEFTLLKKDGAARLARYETPHGEIMTPCFMNVATCGAIKGGLSAYDLRDIGAQVQLCNTYHLSVRPGSEIVRDMGGIRRFTGFDGPVLTDSGGFQVFSLAKLNRITEDGVAFNCHIDGHAMFIGPRESMKIQSDLGSTIAMAFDECVENPAQYGYARSASERTIRWLYACREELAKLNSLPGAVNPEQLLFGINQGCTFDDLRIDNMRRIAELDLDGYAIGGLAVGEPAEVMYRVIEAVEPFMPAGKPRYLMGVGTPVNIIEAVGRGVDLFDCVMPSRNARHGHLFTHEGIININNAKYERDPSPIEEGCGCPACARHSKAYIRHLLKAKEVLGLRLSVMHNLWFYNNLMREIREAIENGTFASYYEENVAKLGRRI